MKEYGKSIGFNFPLIPPVPPERPIEDPPPLPELLKLGRWESNSPLAIKKIAKGRSLKTIFAFRDPIKPDSCPC